MNTNSHQAAFTLIELLVVIAIIGLLSSVVLASLSGARENARMTTARAQLDTLQTALELLRQDTGKRPNGCPVNTKANPEIELDDPNAGLASRPTEGVTDSRDHDGYSPCEWTQAEVDAWDGPYIQANKLIDPWGTPYYYDPDLGCAEAHPELFNKQTIMSRGPDKVINEGAHPGTCDGPAVEIL